MKSLKYKLLVLSSLLSLALTPVVLNGGPVSAAELTKAQQQACYDKYNGHGTGTGTDGKLTSALQDQYNASKCDTAKGGNCAIHGSSRGAIINCTAPTDAADPPTSPDQNPGSGDSGSSGSLTGFNPDLGDGDDFAGSCPTGYHKVSVGAGPKSCCPRGANDAKSCLFAKYLNPLIVVLSIIVGVVVVGSIIAGAIQYSAAGGDPSKVQAAKLRIRNAIFALVVYIFLYSILDWLIPGGIIR